MSVKILTNNKTSPGIGNMEVLGSGKLLHHGVAQWNGTDTSGFLPTGNLKWIEDISFTPIGQLAVGSTSLASTFEFPAVEFAAISATTTFELPPSPVAGTVSASNFVVSTTVATDAANIWTIGVVNKTQSNNKIVDSTVAANSNNSTGGTAFTANTSRALTLTANTTVAIGDVIEVTITKSASAPNLVEFAFGLNITVTSTVTGAVERIELNEAGTVDTTYGTFKVNVNNGVYSVALSRPATPTPTNNLNFFYRMVGYK